MFQTPSRWWRMSRKCLVGVSGGQVVCEWVCQVCGNFPNLKESQNSFWFVNWTLQHFNLSIDGSI
jgi:hypothetical protein